MKQMTNRFVFIFAALLLGAVLPANVAAASKMPSFVLEDVVSGESVDSESFIGKSLLVIFFATWCPPCIEEIPNLKQLHEDYQGAGFSVVALSVDQGTKEVRDLVDEKRINYPVMMADRAITEDFGGVYGIPTSFLVNQDGTVVKRYTGYVPHAVLVRDLEQIMR